MPPPGAEERAVPREKSFSTRPASHTLDDLGWGHDFAAALAVERGRVLSPGRVSRVDRNGCTVLTDSGQVRARLPHKMTGRGPGVAVGDWVGLACGRGGPTAPASEASGRRDLAEHARPPEVSVVLARRSLFTRAGEGGGADQLIAANIDIVLLATAFDSDHSMRRLERYLTLAWQSGARPVVVLTKVDLASPLELSRWQEEISAVALGVEILSLSVKTGQGLGDLDPLLAQGRTVAVLGQSGAGKSSLINALVGSELLATGAVRASGEGRHTTTHRELVVLPGRGVLLDTPGMRALGVTDARQGLRQTFADIEEIASACRFSNCSHSTEPGCAIARALNTGLLDRKRYESWCRLNKEMIEASIREVARVHASDARKARAFSEHRRRTSLDD